MRTAAITLGALAFLYLGISYFFSGLILHTPHRDQATVYQMNKDRWNLDLDSLVRTLPPKKEVAYTAPDDGISLRGWTFTPDTVRCGIVFAHGYSVNRANTLKYAPIFRDCGCAMLMYDHRGHGDSDEAYGTGGYREATDLLAVSEAFAEQQGLPMSRIGWFGESWGAATVILAAERANEQPAWIVAESPFADWNSAVMERGVKEYGPVLKALAPGAFAWTSFRSGSDFDAASPVTAVRQLQVPMLLIHSRADTLTMPAQSDRIAAAAPQDLLTYHQLEWGAWHAHNIIWRPVEYKELVLDFVGDFCK